MKITIQDLPSFNNGLEKEIENNESNHDDYFNNQDNINNKIIINTKLKEERVKKSIFNSFFNLFSFLKKDNNITKIAGKVINRKSSEQIKLEEEVTDLINKNEYLLIDKLIANNYKMTKEQEDLFIKKLSKLIDKEQVHKFNDLLKNGFNIPNKLFEKILTHTTFQIYCWEMLKQLQERRLFSFEELQEKYNKKRPLNYDYDFNYDYKSLKSVTVNYEMVIKKMDEYLKDVNNQIKLFSNFLETIENYVSGKGGYIAIEWSILRPYAYFNDFLITQLSEEKKTEIGMLLNKLKNKLFEKESSHSKEMEIINDLLEDLDIPLTNKNKQLEDLIKRTNQIYGANNTSPIKEEIILIENIPNKEKLPKISQEKVNEIIRIYNIILENKSSVLNTDFNDANRFLVERMPEMIKNYTSLDPKYRDKMKKEDGSTPLSLLNESLDNIIEFLEKINEDINMQKFSNLNSTTNYTKNFKR